MPPKFKRRHIIGGVAASVLLAVSSIAGAQSVWPTKPVKIIVPFAPGDNLGAEQEVAKSLNTPAIKDKLQAQGAIPSGNAPTQFAALIEAEHKKWAEVVKASGTKVD